MEVTTWVTLSKLLDNYELDCLTDKTATLHSLHGSEKPKKQHIQNVNKAWYKAGAPKMKRIMGFTKRRTPVILLLHNLHCLSLKTLNYSFWRPETTCTCDSVFSRAQESHKAGVGKREMQSTLGAGKSVVLVSIPAPSLNRGAVWARNFISVSSPIRVSITTAYPPHGLW